MVEHVAGADFGVDAEVLGEVAEEGTDLVFLLEDVEVGEADGAGVGVLEGGDGPRDIVEGQDAVGISFGEVADFELHVGLSFQCKRFT